ncbi:fungal-specific transcription factor domain-containing protein [Alternaria rosae]|uniref:fungal-specific transcription factor domain-containing protein n=1 Tax=Alternaria rosae TaxID=1187941 RepID=UPI001E8E18BE|nr:fungal-specific transcription factor domain-containing protein [Alternaria rosae]KAH6878608.1 fungal-specific transcription factor domain-containing protein [Alternaria rosae]
MDASTTHQQAASPNGTAKLSNHSPGDAQDWSGDERSSDEEAHDRSQSGTSNKRKRPLSVSCETCKQRKVKCDRGAPACSWCLKNHSACVYLPRKKPGLRAGYGRELESRLDKLEALLVQQQSQINHLSSTQVATSGPSPQEVAAFRSPPVIQTPHIPRPETALFIQKPTFPSQSAIQNQYGNGVTDNRPTPSVTGNGYQSEDVGSMSGGLSRDAYTTYNEQYQPAMSRNLGHTDADFPPYDLLYGLVDLFFKHINTWCPILHRQSTLNSLFGDATLEEADRIILHAVVATTVKFSTDHRLTAEKRTRYHKHSKEKVLLYGIENSSVKSLQALVILALDVVGCSNGPPGWNLLALITRSVVQLGLSVESYSPSVAPQFASIYTLRAMTLPEPKDWIEEESRRRLFWMIYVLDRYATVATAFEFALDEKEIDRRLPCRDDMYARNVPVETRWFHTSTRSDYSMNRPENLGSFSYYVEILGILTRIHKFLKKPVDITSLSDVETWQSEYRELDNAIEQWKYNLPQEFGNSARLFAKPGMGQNLDSGLVMLHAAFHTTVIRLHSSAAYPTHRSPIFTPSFSASQRCLSAVENITALCATVRDNGLLSKLGPPFAFSLWVAARVLLVHGSTIDHRVDQSINLLVSTLQDMGQYWEVGTRYASLLSRVLSEYQESQETPAGANGERVTPSTVKILADMRRCAFDLDFLISRQPKLSNKQNLKIPSVTPARTPAANELEYLDVFDFFNMPRLPVSMDGAMSYPAPDGNIQLPDGGFGNESNITNYMVDASSDWFMKQSA